MTYTTPPPPRNRAMALVVYALVALLLCGLVCAAIVILR
jgi:hypothetical protein